MKFRIRKLRKKIIIDEEIISWKNNKEKKLKNRDSINILIKKKKLTLSEVKPGTPGTSDICYIWCHSSSGHTTSAPTTLGQTFLLNRETDVLI